MISNVSSPQYTVAEFLFVSAPIPRLEFTKALPKSIASVHYSPVPSTLLAIPSSENRALRVSSDSASLAPSSIARDEATEDVGESDEAKDVDVAGESEDAGDEDPVLATEAPATGFPKNRASCTSVGSSSPGMGASLGDFILRTRLRTVRRRVLGASGAILFLVGKVEWWEEWWGWGSNLRGKGGLSSVSCGVAAVWKSPSDVHGYK